MTIAGIPTEQWRLEPDGGRWLFDPGALCLDLAHAGGFGGVERHDSPAALHAWLAERFAGLEGAADGRDLTDALLLRGAVARTLAARARGENAEPADIDVINLFAATPDIPPVLEGGTRSAGTRRVTVRQCLSELARDAVEVAGPRGEGRLRVCAGCGLLFLDVSRPNARRWCSMQRCGNRSKVRAHRARAATRARSEGATR